MSENKLFSDPIISTNDDLDKDYTLDNNGMDLDLNSESMYDHDNANLENTQPYDSNKGSESPSTDLDNQSTNGLFSTEPLPSQSSQTSDNKINSSNQSGNKNSSSNEYEDEPVERHSAKNWIIFGLIGAIILLCLGWFTYSMFNSKEQAKPTQTTTIENNQTPPANPAPDTNNQPSSTDKNTSNSSGSNGGSSSDNSYSGGNDYNSDSSDDSYSGGSSDDSYNSGGGYDDSSSDYNSDSDSSSDSSTDNESNSTEDTNTETNSDEESNQTQTDTTVEAESNSQEEGTDSQASSENVEDMTSNNNIINE